MKKPVVAITIGDPAGIGPEVVLKSLEDPSIYRACDPLVIGDADYLSAPRRRARTTLSVIHHPAEAQYRPGHVDVLQTSTESPKLPPARPSAASGRASAEYVKVSVRLALKGAVNAVVHAPISKTAWKMAGVDYPGHTEMIAQLCGVKQVAMAIVAEPLRTVLVTRHLPLGNVPLKLRADEIVSAIRLSADWMRQRGARAPRIGVCALNPHAGESGMLGNEELRIIAPAVRRAQKILKKNVKIWGPLPADSAFRDHSKGKYHCLITMYHDQSLIPLKLMHPERLVNVTLGLPFARTSPGHGTAFDISGQGVADPAPMKEAILTAARLCG